MLHEVRIVTELRFIGHQGLTMGGIVPHILKYWSENSSHKPANNLRYETDMNECRRPYDQAIQQLQAVGIRPTKQRLAIAKMLFDGAYKHVTAECLTKQAKDEGCNISLATIYNTLHQFTAAGLLRELVVEAGKSYFDTQVENHCHFYCEQTGMLTDAPAEAMQDMLLPMLPEGRSMGRVDVIIRLCPDN